MSHNQRAREGFQRRLLALQRAGAPVWWLKTHGGPFQRAGVPDFIGVARGRGFAIEFKGPGDEISPAQELELDKLDAAGAQVLVTGSVEEAMAKITTLLLKS
jgi:hypothetical protein